LWNFKKRSLLTAEIVILKRRQFKNNGACTEIISTGPNFKLIVAQLRAVKTYSCSLMSHY
jgi:hypothetical protein